MIIRWSKRVGFVVLHPAKPDRWSWLVHLAAACSASWADTCVRSGRAASNTSIKLLQGRQRWVRAMAFDVNTLNYMELHSKNIVHCQSDWSDLSEGQASFPVFFRPFKFIFLTYFDHPGEHIEHFECQHTASRRSKHWPLDAIRAVWLNLKLSSSHFSAIIILIS